jgi:hypothetical protein
MIVIDRIRKGDYSYPSEIIRLEFDKNSVSPFALIEVVMPDGWYSDTELFGQVCAYAGFKSAREDEYQNNMGYEIAEKPWKWGDVALEYVTEYACEMSDTYEDFTRYMSMYNVNVSDHQPEDEEEN